VSSRQRPGPRHILAVLALFVQLTLLSNAARIHVGLTAAFLAALQPCQPGV